MSNTGRIQRIQSRLQPTTPILASSKLVLFVLLVAQIAIGTIYLDDCPRQDYIPIYLIVVGVFGLVLSVISELPFDLNTGDDTPSLLSRVCRICISFASLFLFCWFIAGNVWIYSIYKPNYDETCGALYCHKTLYLFAFWTTTLVYILLGLFLIECCYVNFLVCQLADNDAGSDEMKQINEGTGSV